MHTRLCTPHVHPRLEKNKSTREMIHLPLTSLGWTHGGCANNKILYLMKKRVQWDSYVINNIPMSLLHNHALHMYYNFSFSNVLIKNLWRFLHLIMILVHVKWVFAFDCRLFEFFCKPSFPFFLMINFILAFLLEQVMRISLFWTLIIAKLHLY